MSEKTNIQVQNCTAANTMQVAASKTVALENFTMLSDIFDNGGTLNCTDMIFKTKNSTGVNTFNNANGATLTVNGQVRID